MRLGWTAVGATAGGLLLSALVAVPAQAAPPPVPTIGAPDVTTPGHVTGTITSPEGQFLTLRLGSATLPHAASETAVVLAGDSGPFDLATWGYAGTTYLWAKACRAADSPAEDCTSFVRLEPSFAPSDIVPNVELSEDVTVGPADQIQVTAEDDGGGFLVATWSVPGATAIHTVLDKHGTTNVDTGLPGANGAGIVEVRRCSSPAAEVCASYGPDHSRSYTVKKSVALTAPAIAPITATLADTSVTFTANVTGHYTLDWKVKKGIIDLDPPQGQVEGEVNPDGTLASIPISGTGLQETGGSEYRFEVTISVQDPDFGTVVGTAQPTFKVDRGVPVPGKTTVDNPTIYPNVNLGPYRASAKIVSAANFLEFGWYAIRDAQGTLVRVIPRAPGNLQSGIWDGKNDQGVLVPAGTYRIHARDDVGNESPSAATITVSHQKLVTRTWKRKVRAKASVIDTYVGRCSALRSPATRGWKGSVGLYANVRCGNKSSNASTAATLHATKLIRAPRYLSIQVRAYGGASRRAAGSTAFLRYVKVPGGTTHQVRLRPALRTQMGATLSFPTAYIRASDRLFKWNVYTNSFNRYDVRDFTVIVRYQTLG